MSACMRVRRCPVQRGFSLIELMVAMVIALLMLGAILQLFLDITRTNDDMARTNAQMENGRFALQLIANDLQHAGFWDGYVPQFDDLTTTAAPTDYPDPAITPEPCKAFPPSPGVWSQAYRNELLGMPLQVFDTVPTGCSGLVTSKKADSDVLVVRYASTSVTDSAGFDANDVYFQASFCSSTSYDYWLDKKAAFADFDWLKRDNSAAIGCASGLQADVRKFISHLYYIRNDDTLMRAEFENGVMGSAQPLIDGVESMIVELGVDDVSDSGGNALDATTYGTAVTWADDGNKKDPTNRGDGSPDGAFVHCEPCSINQMANAVAARVYLLVRSTEASPGYTDSKTYSLGSTTLGPFNDGFKRHVYSTAVRLTNVSARRETP